MRTLPAFSQKLLALTLLALLPLLAWGAVIQPLQMRYQSAEQQQQSLQQQLERYQRVNLSHTQLQTQQTQLQQWMDENQTMLKGRTQPLRSADLQQALGSILNSSGAELVQAKALKPAQQGRLEVTRLKATLRASLPQLLDTLTLLHEGERHLSLEALTVQARPMRTIRGSQRSVVSPLEVTLQLRGYALPGEGL